MALDDDDGDAQRPDAKRQRRREGRDDGQDDKGGINFGDSICWHRQGAAYEEDGDGLRGGCGANTHHDDDRPAMQRQGGHRRQRGIYR